LVVNKREVENIENYFIVKDLSNNFSLVFIDRTACPSVYCLAFALVHQLSISSSAMHSIKMTVTLLVRLNVASTDNSVHLRLHL